MSRTRREKRARNLAGKVKQESARSAARPQDNSVRRSDSFSKSALSGRALWVSVALTAAIFFVYASVWRHGFLLNWDDTVYITDNPQVLSGVTWPGVLWAFKAGVTGNWHPVTWLSHMLDVQIFGLNAGGHHLTSLALHSITTILLFGLLHGVTGAIGRSAFVAGLFALHPLHVESVAWAAERKDVLSALFWILTLWAYCRFVRQPRPGHYLWVVALFALGLMSKSMLVTLPFTLLLMDVWPLERTSLRSRSNTVPTAWTSLIREKVPLFIIAALASIVTFRFQQSAGAVGALETLPLSFRLENAVISYVAYIGKLIWPTSLAALYPIPHSIPAWQVLSSALLLLAISYGAVRIARRCPYVPVGWFWYLGTLIPVIGLIQVGAQAMADRYTYIPSIGIFIIAAWGIPDLVKKWKDRESALLIGGLSVLIACAAVTHNQVRYWNSSEALWTHTLDVTGDNHRAHHFLADALLNAGRYEEAVRQYSEALRLEPAFVYAHYGLGNALQFLGKRDDAMAQYAEAVRQKSDFPEAQVNLGGILLDKGRITEAIAHFTDALRVKPDMSEAHANLGNALSQQGKIDDAIREYDESLRFKPDANVHFNAGLAFARIGNRAEAIRHLEAALRLNPNHAPARKQLDSMR